MTVNRELIEKLGYNPGAQVRLILEGELPQEQYDTRSFANSVDRALVASGQLADLIRDSTLDYATRRLVAGAHFVLSSGGWSADDGAFTVALRRYLREHTDLPSSTRERLLPHLREAADLRDEDLGRKAKRDFRRRERERGHTKCYLCGQEMEFSLPEAAGGDAKTPDLYATVEHIWPHRLGGLNVDSNLLLACSKCNGAKDDALTGSDFHYERFVRAEESSLTVEDQLMAWYHAGLQCARCERPPIQVGELRLVRDDEGDCWHVHNVSAYCSLHLPAD